MTDHKWSLSGLFLLLLLGAAEAAEFTADLVISEGKEVRTGRIMVRGELYRMELSDLRGPDVVVQMYPGKDLCRVLVPRYSLYIELSRGHGMVQMFDPFLAAESVKKHYECVDVGTEEWAGQTCTKQAFKRNEKVILNRWISTDLGFALRIKMLAREGYFTELTNINKEAVGEALFAVPDGFTKCEWPAIIERVDQDPEMQAKQKAFEANRIRDREENIRLTVGGEYRALVGKDIAIKLTVKQTASADFAWSVVAMKGDEALPARKMTGPGEVRFAADSGVTVVILRCDKGECWGKVALSGRRPLLLATTTLTQQDSGGGMSATLRPDCRCFRIRIKSLEVPGESTRPVRVQLSLQKPQGASGEHEKLEFHLQPGEDKIVERTGEGILGGYDVILMDHSGGRAEVEITVDFRPEGEQKPF